MSTVNISLPESMRPFIERMVVKGGFGSADEYVQRLVSEDQKRASQERLEALLLEGIESGPSVEMTQEYWAEKKARLLEQIGNTNE
jgi:antitoxin ParD1/3/4